MADASSSHADPLRLDADNECLWRGEQGIQLTPTAFALVRYLIAHSGRLVTKDELLATVWPEVVVSENALTTHIGAIRQALGDNAKAPRYIETVHRRGYRFIGKVVSGQQEEANQKAKGKNQKAKVEHPSLAPSTQHLTPTLVGREAELTQLHSWLDKALSGERQLVFVTGEAGIGKTTLVEVFLFGVRSHGKFGVQGREESQNSKVKTQKSKVRVPSPQASSLKPLVSPVSFAHGQCIEHFGAGEAYLPVLAALGQLGREAHGQYLVEVLHQYAPTWLIQLPALVKPDEFEALQRRTAGATRTRMLREMAEALEVLTSKHPLVLVLEDLHWSDPSTLELLSFIARRKQRARLLVLGTYRPVDVLANGHPLRAVTQELQLHRHCEELPLSFLSEAAVAEYLTVRFAVEAYSHTPLPELATTIYRRTEGNPLFMVNIVDNLFMQGTLDSQQIESSTPTTIRQMIERQFDRLHPAEQNVLAVASVVGAEFSAAAVAAGVNAEVVEVETHCAELARREQFLWRSDQSTWPDGAVAGRYRFRHALYQEAIYERMATSQKAQWHHRIGERLEAAYGQQAGEIAAELAVHFERAHDYPKTIRYLEQAGKTAIRRSAHVEAITHLTKGLALLKDFPETPERDQQELNLQVPLGGQLLATKGFAAPEAGKTYTRAYELCHRLGDTSQLFHVLWGLAAFHTVRSEYQQTYELGQQLLTLAQSKHDLALLVEAHYVVGQTFFFLGNFPLVREHLGEIIRLYDHHQHHALAFVYGYDPGVMSRSMMSTTLWLLGYPHRALKMSSEAIALAQTLAHPSSLAFARVHAGGVHKLRGEEQAAQESATALITLSTEQKFALMSALGTLLQGQVLAEQGKEKEGLTLVLQGLDAHKATGADHRRPRFFSVLAWIYGRIGQPEEGLTQLGTAFAVMTKTEERQWEAELYRLKGELTLQQANQKSNGKSRKKLSVISCQLSVSNTQGPTSQAEACFLRAIEVAQKQQAKSLELRATISLARLWQQQGKGKQAHKVLSEIYYWFTEGFDTKDLQEAQALIESLSH